MFFALIYGVQSKTVFLPNPTWANHIPIFRRAGFNVQHYAYFNPSNCSLNLQGMLEDISVAPPPLPYLTLAEGAGGLHLPSPRVRAQPDWR